MCYSLSRLHGCMWLRCHTEDIRETSTRLPKRTRQSARVPEKDIPQDRRPKLLLRG